MILRNFYHLAFEVQGGGSTLDELGHNDTFVNGFFKFGGANTGHFHSALFGQELILLQGFLNEIPDLFIELLRRDIKQQDAAIRQFA